MTDNQIYDFFKSRSNSFDEMPSDDLWNKINQNLNSQDSEVSNSFISKKVLFLILATTSALFLTLYFLNNYKEKSLPPNDKKEIQLENKEIAKPEVTINYQEVVIKKIDTTKRKRVPKMAKKLIYYKRFESIQTNSNTTNPKVENLKIDSLKPNEDIDIKPQVLGNRYLFQSQKQLTKEEYDLLVKKILKENELNYGKLIVIRVKGQKPFRQIIQSNVKSCDTIKARIIFPSFHVKAQDSIHFIKKDSLILKEKL